MSKSLVSLDEYDHMICCIRFATNCIPDKDQKDQCTKMPCRVLLIGIVYHSPQGLENKQNFCSVNIKLDFKYFFLKKSNKLSHNGCQVEREFTNKVCILSILTKPQFPCFEEGT